MAAKSWDVLKFILKYRVSLQKKDSSGFTLNQRAQQDPELAAILKSVNTT